MSQTEGRSIQVVAWLVLLGSFAAFVIGVVGLPWLSLRWWRGATQPLQAVVACKTGSCALGIHGSPPVAHRMDSGPAEVPEGTTFATDGRSRGYIRLFDGATANLESDTTVTLDRMRRPRFPGSTATATSVLFVHTPAHGRVARLSVGTTWKPTVAIVRCQHGTARIAPESRVRIEVRPDLVRVLVAEGRAEVTLGDRTVGVGADQLVESTADTGPGPPQRALENALQDGDFNRPIDNARWKVRVDLPGAGSGVVPPTVESIFLADAASGAARISRSNSDARPADLILEQGLGDRDVTWSQLISVRARLRVNGQSLPLGGTRASEFPAILKLVAETENGNQYDWRVGFYAVLPPPEEPADKYVAAATDVQVPLGEWYEFDSGNLLDPETTHSFSRFDWPSSPVRLKRFEIIASGHDYAADIDLVEIWVK